MGNEQAKNKSAGLIKHLGSAAFLAVTLAVSAGATAQSFPSKPVRFIMPFGAGGISEAGTRLIAQHLEAKWKQTILVEPRPGGNEIPATMATLKEPADGHTIMYASQNIPLNPLLFKQPFELKELQMISRNFEFGYFLFTGPDFPAKSLQEFVAMAKSSPGKVSYGHIGNFTKIKGLEMAEKMGTKFIEVSFPTPPAVQTSVLAGHVNYYFGTGFDLGVFGGGKGKILATTTPQRNPKYPDIPAIAEVAPGYDLISWTGFLTRAGTPRAVVDQLSRDINEAARNQNVIAFHSERFFNSIFESADQATAYVTRQNEQFAVLVKKAGIVQQ